MNLVLLCLSILPAAQVAPGPGVGSGERGVPVAGPTGGADLGEESVWPGSGASLSGTIPDLFFTTLGDPLPEPEGPEPGIRPTGHLGGLQVPDPEASRWSALASGLAREVNGHLRVREFTVSGSTLNFRKDLGLDIAEGGQAALNYRGSGLEGMFEVEYLTASGRHTLDRDVFYNGTRYAANLPIHTGWGFTTVRALLAFKELLGGSPSWEVDPVAGVEYPYYLTNVTSSVTPHNSEDWTHNYPYPVAGFMGRFTPTQELTVGVRLTVGYVPDVPSAFTEGGRLHVSIRPSVSLDLPLEWRVSEHLILCLDLQYRYWNGGDHSVEDGNVLRFSTPGASVGIGYRW
jgi:hypothetical protein